MAGETGAANPRQRRAILTERRVFITTGKRTRQIRLSGGVQLAGLSAALLLIGWSVFATALVATDAARGWLAAGDARAAAALRADLIERMSSRTLQLADELSESRAAVDAAMEMLADSHAETSAALARARDAEAALNRGRAQLAQLSAAHAALSRQARAEAERALIAAAERDEAEARLAARDAEMTALSATLSDTATTRDSVHAERAALRARLEELQTAYAVSLDRQARIYARLEEAASVSLGALEDIFQRSDIDVNRILAEVGREHTGAGGLFAPIDMPEDEAGAPDAASARASELIGELARLDALRTAVEQAPFMRPVSAARFTSGFGPRRDPKNGRRAFHSGIDLAGPRGTPVRATGAGEVVFSGRKGGYGNTIKIRHAFGFESVYAHLDRRRVSVGDWVERGERIGDMGNTGRSTGTHLHYEIRMNGKPVNPAKYIEAARNVF